MIEILIASSIALMAMSALFSLNILIQRFIVEAAGDGLVMEKAAQAIDAMTREINSSYRLDAVDQTRVFSIQNSNQTFEYSTGTGAALTRKRFRFDSANNKIIQEIKIAGAWTATSTQPIANNIASFSVENPDSTNGIITLVVKGKITVARYKDRQFTLIGRALPRNL